MLYVLLCLLFPDAHVIFHIAVDTSAYMFLCLCATSFRACLIPFLIRLLKDSLLIMLDCFIDVGAIARDSYLCALFYDIDMMPPYDDKIYIIYDILIEPRYRAPISADVDPDMRIAQEMFLI